MTIITFHKTPANLMKSKKTMINNYSTALIRSNQLINRIERHYSNHHNSNQIVKICWMNRNKCMNKDNKRNNIIICKREIHLERFQQKKQEMIRI